MRRLTGLLFLVIVIAAAGAFAWWRNNAPLEVEMAREESGVEVRLFGIGTIEAQVAARIGFQLAGRLVSVSADQGQILETGSVIAQLDPAVQRARLQKAQVALLQSESTLVKAQALLARAQVNLRQREATAERRRTLVERGATTREAADDAQAQAEIAKADVAVAQAEVTVASTARKDFAATIAIEQALLDQHTLKTPFRSRVISRLKEEGSAINPAEPVFSIIAPETIWVRAFIDEALAGSVKLGQKAFVRLRSDPHRLVETQVVRIDEENDRATEERRIYVRCIKCKDEHLVRHLGEQAEVEIVTGQIAKGLFIPIHAIDKYNGRSGSVWLVENGKLVRRNVTFAERLLDGRVRLADTLPDGVSVVITRQATNLREGRTARITAARP
jgi:HlyD family secretion protein